MPMHAPRKLRPICIMGTSKQIGHDPLTISSSSIGK